MRIGVAPIRVPPGFGRHQGDLSFAARAAEELLAALGTGPGTAPTARSPIRLPDTQVRPAPQRRRKGSRSGPVTPRLIQAAYAPPGTLAATPTARAAIAESGPGKGKGKGKGQNGGKGQRPKGSRRSAWFI